MFFDIDDAEDQNIPYAYYSPETLQQDTVQNVWLVPHTATNTVPLQVNRQQVMLELIDASSTGERLGLDLVAVLDVSESMDFPGKHRLGKMKTAMQFLIKKLSPIDRLSIVTFSDVAKRLCPLRAVTQVSQAHLMDLVDGLTASGRAYIQAGLETGHKVLNDRCIAGGRVASIFLLSGGDQNKGDATIVDVSDVAVYTFGFGADYDPKVLDEIARKSKGGTFSFVEDGQSMSKPLSQIVGGLLSIVVQDLKLTVSPQPGDSAIEKVNAGLYLQTRDANTGSVTVSFGDLFAREVRRIIVDALLPAVHKGKKVTAIIAYCTYRFIKGTISLAQPTKPNIVVSRMSSNGFLGGRFSQLDVINFGGIPADVAAVRSSDRIRAQPNTDATQLQRAQKLAQDRGMCSHSDYIAHHPLDPYVVLPAANGKASGFGYWVQPVGNGCTGYIQPVQLAF